MNLYPFQPQIMLHFPAPLKGSEAKHAEFNAKNQTVPQFNLLY
jgi:hypothetical protein